jgi:hypothetical protein
VTLVAAGFITSALPSFASSLCAVPGNLVLNCGFETGNFTDWTLSGNTGSTSVDAGSQGHPNSGSYDASLGPMASDGFLSQALNTVASEPYTFSFYMASDGGTPNAFSAFWDGTPEMSCTNCPGSGAISYSLYFFSVVGTGSDTITCESRNVRVTSILMTSP